jgi:hypothetical protein
VSSTRIQAAKSAMSFFRPRSRSAAVNARSRRPGPRRPRWQIAARRDATGAELPTNTAAAGVLDVASCQQGAGVEVANQNPSSRSSPTAPATDAPRLRVGRNGGRPSRVGSVTVPSWKTRGAPKARCRRRGMVAARRQAPRRWRRWFCNTAARAPMTMIEGLPTSAEQIAGEGTPPARSPELLL